MRPVVIFGNPHSGRHNPARLREMQLAVKDKFGSCGFTDKVGELEQIRNSHIIVAGGDGTVHIAATHADLGSNTFSIVAMGSGNDFIKNFPKRNFASLLAQIEQDTPQKCDLLEVNGKKATVLVGVGFDAFVSHVAKQNKIKIPALKYLIPVARHMFFYKGIHMDISGKDVAYSGRVFMLSCGNGFRAGGGFKLFPKASISDGKMDVLIIEPPTFWQKLKYVWLVNFGKHLNLKIVKYIQTDAIRVDLKGEDFFNTDGDVYRSQSMEIRLLPEAWNLIM